MYKGVLIDLDGVMYVEDEVVTGAAQTIEWLRRRGVAYRFLTNTTMKSRLTLHRKLTAMGIDIGETDIFSAVYAAAQYVRQKPGAISYVLLADDARNEFRGVESNSAQVDYVVVGDLGEQVSYHLLNEAFRRLINGAELVALQKNRYWMSSDGLSMDAGAFVAALEFAAEKTAVLIGKPAPSFFQTALADMGLTASDVIMVGDDLVTDIQGAQALGIRAALTRTGKFRPTDLQRPDIRPDWALDSIAQLPELGLF